VRLAIADGGAIPNVHLSGQFLLEVNSFLSDKLIRTFQTNGEAGVAGPPNILATDPDTGSFVLGDVTIHSGIHIVLEGALDIGTAVHMNGRFEFTFSPNPFVIDIKVHAAMSLFGIGQFDIDGVLRLDRDGLAAYIDLSIGAGFGGQIGLSFNVQANLQLYFGSLNEKVLTLATGDTVTVKQGFKLHLAGSVTFLGFAEASGSVTITLQRDVFSIEFDVSLNLGPLSVEARGGAAIYMDSHPGMALVLDVQVNANILEIIKIKASGKLELNTSNTARTLAGVHMNAQSFVLALSGEVRFLEVIKFDASFLLEVGYDGVGSWRVEFRASMDFFGLATLQAHGMFNYKGHFDFTLDGRVILGTDSFGLRADFHFRVAFGEREDPENPGLNEFFFLVEASASAKLRAFGITFGGVSIAFSLTAHGSGRVPLVIDARASIDFAFFSITVHMKFTLGYIELPKPVYLAGNPTGDPRLWDPVAANGVLVLDMGARNAERGIGEGEDDEMYIIEHAGSTADGEIVRVIFSGRETLFKGVKKIVAFGGAGDDHVYVKEGVTSDVELHGGDGNDVFVYEGSGRMTTCRPAWRARWRSCTAAPTTTSSCTPAAGAPRSTAARAVTGCSAARPTISSTAATAATRSTAAAAWTRSTATAATTSSTGTTRTSRSAR